MSEGDLVGRYVDGASVRWAALTVTVVGTIIYSYVLGLVEIIGRLESGITGALDGLGSWLAGTILGEFFRPPTYALELAWQPLIEFSETFGAAAPLVAVVVVALVVGLTIFLARAIVGRLLEVYSL